MCAAEGKVLCGVDEPCNNGGGCSYDDCARVSGNELYVYADDGDDIVEAVGDYIYLDGGWGDDTLAASGGYNYVVGQGGVDTCFNGGEGGCTCEIKDCGDEDETSESAAVAP